MSRSSRSRRISRRRRRISSRSAVLGPSPRRPSSRSPCTTQLRIACAVGSNSRDNSSGLRPVRTNSTIWRRNSGAYGGLDLGMVDTSSPKGQVSTNSDQLQTRRFVGKWCGERTREIALTVSPQASAWEGDCPSSPLDRGSTDSAMARYHCRSLTLRLTTSLPSRCRGTGLDISTLDTPRHPDPARLILVRQPRSGGYFFYTCSVPHIRVCNNMEESL